MAHLRSRLPPVNALVVFEAAARHLNFTRAAAELAVTQAAVSRQILGLEAHLGVPLFRRLHRGLELSGDGLRLRDAVAMGLEHIARAAGDIRRVRDPSEVTVATSVTFASYWLIARLAKFRAANPDLELKLVASGPIRDMASAGVDVAVRYGKGRWPGTEAVHLLDNEVFPVCSPSYLQGRKPLQGVADFLDQTLLHLVEFDHNWVTWEAWLRSFGIDAAPRGRGLEFDNYLILVQAALDGQGVALVGSRLADDFLARGTLIRPLEASLVSDQSFYLLQPAQMAPRPAARRFRDWILAEAKAWRSAGR